MALTRMILWFGMIIIVMVTLTKFMFICVWKSMRPINDDLIVRIAVNQALLCSIIIGLLKTMPRVSSAPICIGIYDQDAALWRQSTSYLDQVLLRIIVVLFFLTLGLASAVFIGKRKMLENNHLMSPPKSLESLVLNIAVIGLVVINLLCNTLYWRE